MTFKHPGLKFMLFAALCLVAAGYVVSVTGNIHRIPFITPTNTYSAVLNDVEGLFPGDDVRLSGVRVGRVERIAISKGNAVVSFRLPPDVEVLDSWETGVRWRNIIGSRQLYLYPIPGGDQLEPGGELPVTQSRRTADIGRFVNEITPLLKAIDPEAQNQLLTELNKALVGRSDEVSELTSDLGHLGNTIADREAAIDRALANGNTFLATYNEREAELQAVLTDLADVGGVLRERNDEVLAAFVDIAEVQKQFGDLLAANDEELDSIAGDLETITDTIGDNRHLLEPNLATLPDGLATYNLISRWGQWFNVRGVGVQVQRNGQVLFCRVEQNGPCGAPNDTPEKQEPGREASQANAAATRTVSLAPQRRSAVEVLSAAALGQRSVALDTGGVER